MEFSTSPIRFTALWRQMTELFKLDASSLYLFDRAGLTCGASQRSVIARSRAAYTASQVQPELLHISSRTRTFLSAQGLQIPMILREAQRQGGCTPLCGDPGGPKDRVLGGLVVGSRTSQGISPADMNLLIAVGSQISNAIDRSVLYETTRQVYEILRRTQEQLLHSEKMAPSAN